MGEESRLVRAVSRLRPGWHGINAALCALGFILAVDEADSLGLAFLLLAGACFSLWAALTSHRLKRRD